MPTDTSDNPESKAILGISAYYHDSAAALLINGEIVAAAEEPRVTAVVALSPGRAYRGVDALSPLRRAALAEIALAILLVPRRTRTIAVVGSAAMLLAIEVAAREVFFGLERFQNRRAAEAIPPGASPATDGPDRG